MHIFHPIFTVLPSLYVIKMHSLRSINSNFYNIVLLILNYINMNLSTTLQFITFTIENSNVFFFYLNFKY